MYEDIRNEFAESPPAVVEPSHTKKKTVLVPISCVVIVQ